MKRVTKLIIALALCISMFSANFSAVEAKEKVPNKSMEEMKSYLSSIGTPNYILDTYDKINPLRMLYEKVYTTEGNITCAGSTIVLNDGSQINTIADNEHSNYLTSTDTITLTMAYYVETVSIYNSLITKCYVNVNYHNNGSVNFSAYDFAASNWDSSVFTYNSGSLEFWLETNGTTYMYGTTPSALAQGGIGWKTVRPISSELSHGHAVFELLPKTYNIYTKNVDGTYTRHTTNINAEYGFGVFPTGLGFSVANGIVTIDASLFADKVANSVYITYYTN